MAGLRKAFHPDQLEHRLNSCGKNTTGIWAQSLTYVTSRAIQERFDQVCGGGWQLKTRFENNGAVCICSIGVKLDGEWVWREDGSDPSDIEAVKGALSGAVKRAAVLWGIGRDLYGLGDGWATICEKDPHDDRYYKAFNQKLGKTDEKATFWWLPPMLPPWYMKLVEGGPAVEAPAAKASTPLPTPTLPAVDIEKILTAFSTRGIKREDVEAHVGGIPCEQWTTVHAALLREKIKALIQKEKKG